MQTKYISVSSNDYINYENTLNFTYLGFPLYVERSSNKFSANLGLIPLILLKDNWRTKIEGMTNDSFYTTDTVCNFSIDKFDLGIRVGFTYNIYKRFHIESNFFFGVKNIFVKDDEETEREYLYNQQLTFGLRYDLIK